MPSAPRSGSEKLRSDKDENHIHIGTSGWSYLHWKGLFYPGDLKAIEHFAFYQRKFHTVELNNPFYRLPSKSTFKKWKDESSDNFIFAIKASRFITHMKKLNDVKGALDLMLENISVLKHKAGPILFQLPPNWKLNVQRFHSFLKLLPPQFRYTFEFRNSTWYTAEVYELLKQFRCAFCIYDLAGHQSPLEVTTDFVYIRLHGPGNKYQGNYSLTTLKKWAKRCKDWRARGLDVYFYFDNDQASYAAFNAIKLDSLVNK